MDTIETTATVLFIVAAASIFGWMLTVTKTTELIAGWVLAFTQEPWVFLLLANGLMLFVGCFLEPVAAITILVPVLMPIVLKLGIDPVHFGLIMVLNLMIGLVTPPVGLCLYAISSVSNVPISELLAEMWPYIIALLIVLGIVTFVPDLSTWLPRQFGLGL
jgi:tripartite ATP-independent transporter DctM subunit